MDPYRQISLCVGILSGSILFFLGFGLCAGILDQPVLLGFLAILGAVLTPALSVWARVRAARRCSDVQRLAKWLADRDDMVRTAAAQALGASGDASAVEILIGAMARSGWSVYPAVVKALVQLGPLSVEPLTRVLGDERPCVRDNAARALGQIGDARAAGSLVLALDDSDLEVRVSAAWSLMDIGTPAVQPTIVALEGNSPRMRSRAGRVLGRLGDAQSVEPLIQALGDESGGVRAEAAEALGYLRNARAVGPLVAALDDGDGPVRASAAIALGSLGAAAGPALPALCRRAGEGHAFVGAIREIEKAVRAGRRELLAAEAPGGTGTEPEAGSVPQGRGDELSVAEPGQPEDAEWEPGGAVRRGRAR